MSELKATTVYDAYWKANSVGEGTGTHVYLKSEADKVIAELEEKLDIYKRGWMENDRVNANQYKEIRHHKYKRCLAMAKWCDAKADWYYSIGEFCRDRVEFYIKWHESWLKLAEKFKPNN